VPERATILDQALQQVSDEYEEVGR
jgi:hypothetical protein